MENEWELDLKHSGISFSVRYMLVARVRGRFKRWGGALRFDEKDPAESSVEVQIDASSIDTFEPQRDAHLRSPDFLDAEGFPRITFKSRRVERVAARSYRIKGDLTIRGVTRPVELHAEHGGVMRDPCGRERAGFSAKLSIDRKDWGISFNQVLDHGGLALGEQVAIEIDVEAVRPAQQATESAHA